MNTDPLDKIFQKTEELDNQRKVILADLLNPFVRIDLENGAFLPTIIWSNLTTQKQVLVYMLAKLALSSRNPKFQNQATPKEVTDNTEIPGGTVRPKLTELLKDKLISKNEFGGYYVKPTILSLQKIKRVLEGDLLKLGDDKE